MQISLQPKVPMPLLLGGTMFARLRASRYADVLASAAAVANYRHYASRCS